MQDIRLFTSQPKAKFYDNLFLNLELPENFCKGYTAGRKGFPKYALLCAFIVMKCEDISQITDLVDYLDNNRLIAHYCGFDITKELPSYWTYDRFIRNLDNEILQVVMHFQVLRLAELGIIDTSFIAFDSTPVFANTKHNNSKSFVNNKFSKENPPRADKDCSLGVHTASNHLNEKNFDYYWGYKNHVLVDCITGLPIKQEINSAVRQIEQCIFQALVFRCVAAVQNMKITVVLPQCFCGGVISGYHRFGKQLSCLQRKVKPHTVHRSCHKRAVADRRIAVCDH